MMEFQQLARFERINVVGTSGSGKSTFARELAKLLDLPCYEMDQLYWKSNWQESSDEEFFPKVRDIASAQRWILDGNYTRTTADKWRQAQLVVWLDLSFTRTIFRVTRRAFRRSLSQQEIWPGTGNRESLRKAFLTRDSIIWWAITTHRGNRKKYQAMMASPAYSHICFVRLTSPKSVAACLEGVRRVVESPQ